MGAGTIQTAARAARIGMKFFITAIGAAQFLNAARHSFLSRLACASAEPSVKVLRTMSNPFHSPHCSHNTGGTVIGVARINETSHRDSISGLLGNFHANETLERGSVSYWDCTKHQHKVLLQYLDDASPQSSNRPVLAAASRRWR
jgi:hypothetical protein